jgi:hypothetical protein
MAPGISTTWPTLQSCSPEKFSELLENSDMEAVIIRCRELPERADVEKKNDILMDYIDVNDYNVVFMNEKYEVYINTGIT